MAPADTCSTSYEREPFLEAEPFPFHLQSPPSEEKESKSIEA